MRERKMYSTTAITTSTATRKKWKGRKIKTEKNGRQ
jgi:hypothetical protein